MSVVKETLLVCDGCGDTFAAAEQRSYTGRLQRHNARVEGWVYSKGKDYCDECKLGPR